jgi:hypothetical protein
MNPTIVGMIVFACTMGGALLGIWLRSVLPEHHLSDESRDTIKLGIGLIATMTALVLGLVTASAKNSFDSLDTAVKHTAMDILTLDRLLARYGPETREIRVSLKDALGRRIDLIWPRSSTPPIHLDELGAGAGFERIVDAIRRLKPRDDYQQSIKSLALNLAESLLQTRWLMIVSTETSIPMPFLGVMMFWLTITFLSFGLFAPRNATVLGILLVCALSVGSAVFLILEMGEPFSGVLKVSADPLRHAYALLNH